jgi:hypothetical protein
MVTARSVGEQPLLALKVTVKVTLEVTDGHDAS